MEYKELLDLGFARCEYEDSVYTDKYGFKPFEMIFETREIKLVWEPFIRQGVTAMYINNSYYKELESLQDVVEVLDCFKD